jgi:hypothetical protein
MAIVLEKGHGKDDDPNHPYVRAHPTNYNWRDDIEKLTRGTVNRYAFRNRIWINTYHHHPPGGPDDFWRHRDTTSFDVWGFDDRGDPLPKLLGDQVFHTCCSVTQTRQTSGGSCGRAECGAASRAGSSMRLRGL